MSACKVKGLKKLLIIGGGFGGCTIVHEYSKKHDWEITVVEPNSEFGGGVRTRFKSGHPYTFGPRHFLTQKEYVFEYLSNHLNMRLCSEHQFISFVGDDNNFYNYPIHYDDIKRMSDSSKIYNEIDSLEAMYKDAEFQLTTGSPDLDIAKRLRDFWKNQSETHYIKNLSRHIQKKCG